MEIRNESYEVQQSCNFIPGSIYPMLVHGTHTVNSVHEG